MNNNIMKEKLRSGKNVVGLFQNVINPNITEIMGLLGFDFVIVDGEHTTFNPNLAEEHFRAAELRNISSVTRIGQNDQQVIQKFLDAGSQGVLMPLINNKSDALEVVDSVKYPPIGKRGLASGRGSSYGIPQSVKEHVDHSNKETLVAIQIETTEAMENVEEISSIEEVDVLFFGPSDISSSFGIHGQINDPKVRDTISSLSKIAIGNGKSCGTIARDANDFKFYKEAGFQWFCSGVTNMMQTGMKEYLSELK
ncbi:MAG: aldolase [Chloroflexi bacterium]|nr:aldolase [Chloroflexota bacterium]|tara:strand:- start:1156 stop:1914 length:759 start_codon:yes stop_codon:yes gene_type:complete